MSELGLPTMDRVLAVYRQFLCQKAEDPALLDEFKAELPKLRLPAVEIKARVDRHTEYLHNTSVIPLKEVDVMRAKLEHYALGYAGRCYRVLEETISGAPPGVTDRAEKLLVAVRAERAKGA